MQEEPIYDQEEQAQSYGEAPAVIFTQLYGVSQDGQIVQFNLTCRAGSPEEAVDVLMRGIKYARDKYKLSPAKPGASPAPAQPAQNGAPAPAAPTAQPPAPQSNNGGGVIHAIKMDVMPQTGGAV